MTWFMTWSAWLPCWISLSSSFTTDRLTRTSKIWSCLYMSFALLNKVHKGNDASRTNGPIDLSTGASKNTNVVAAFQCHEYLIFFSSLRHETLLWRFPRLRVLHALGQIWRMWTRFYVHAKAMRTHVRILPLERWNACQIQRERNNGSITPSRTKHHLAT